MSRPQWTDRPSRRPGVSVVIQPDYDCDTVYFDLEIAILSQTTDESLLALDEIKQMILSRATISKPIPDETNE